MKATIFFLCAIVAFPLYFLHPSQLDSSFGKNDFKFQKSPLLVKTLGGGTLTTITCSEGLNLVAASSTEGMWLYQAKNLNTPPTQIGDFSAVTEMAIFDAEESRLMSYGYDYEIGAQVVRLWNLNDNSETNLAVNTDSPLAIAFDTANDPIIATYNLSLNNITVTNILTSEKIVETNLGSRQVINMAFNPAGSRLAFSDNQGQVYLWTLETNEISILGHEKEVTQLKFNSDGSLLAIADWNSNSLEVMDVSILPKSNLLFSKVFPDAKVTGLEFDGSGEQITYTVWGDNYYSLSAIDLTSGDIIYSYDIDIFSLMNSNAKLGVVKISTCSSLGFLILDWETGGQIRHIELWKPNRNSLEFVPLGLVFPYHSPNIVTSAFSPDDGLFITFSEDRIVRKWDIYSTQVPVTSIFDYPFTRASLNSIGTLLAIGDSNGKVRVLDINSSTELFSVNEHTSVITSLKFNSNATSLAIGDQDGLITLWNIETRSKVYSFHFSSPTPIETLDIHSSYIGIGTWNSLVVLNFEQGIELFSTSLDKRSIRAMAFSESNFILATSLTGSEEILPTVRLWFLGSINDWKDLSKDDHEVAIAVILNKEGTIISTKSLNGKVTISFINDQGEDIEFESQSGDQLLMDHKDTLLATGGDYGIIEIWSVEYFSQDQLG